MASQFVELPLSGGGVTSLNTQTGDLTLVAGANVSITPGAGTLTIAASGSGLGDINDGGNSFGSAISIGTNDNFGLNFETNNVIASSVDTSQQWSFGAQANPNRVHGFYKDVNAGESTNSVFLRIGNSGASQGVGQLSFSNQLANNAPTFDIAFNPRNNADSGILNAGLIRMQKGAATDATNMYFSTSDSSGTLNVAATIDPDGNLQLGPENALQFADAVGGQYVAFKAPATVTGTTTYVLPDAPPASNKVLQSDSSSVLTWVDNSTIGTANTFGGFDGSGNLYTIPGWGISTTSGGAAVNLLQTIAADNQNIKIQNFETEVNPAIASTNDTYHNVFFDIHLDRTGSDNDYGGQLYNINMATSLEGDGDVGAVFGINSSMNLGIGSNSATVTNASSLQLAANVGAGYTVTGFSGIRSELTGSGTVTGAAMLTNITNVSIANNLDIIYSSFGNGNTVSGNFRGIHFDINGDVTGQSEGLNIGFTGDTGADLNGITVNNTGDVAGNLNAFNANISGAITGNIVGINVNLQSATTTTQKVGMNINDGALVVSSNYDTGILPASPGFVQMNNVGGLFSVASGDPMTNTLVFGNNLGVPGKFEDDMGPDSFGGFGGFSVNGLVGQLAVAATKTVSVVNMMLAAGSIPTGVIPTDGGTIESLAMYRAYGLLNAGGSLVVDNAYGFKCEDGISTYATNAWGVHVSSTTADNWFKKNVVIGGVTEQPTGSDALDVTGSAVVTGNIKISTAGSGLLVKEGSNARMGVVTLVAGTATVSNTSVTATSRIFLTSQVDGGTPGFVRVSARTAATSFTITSSNAADTSDIAWLIVEPA